MGRLFQMQRGRMLWIGFLAAFLALILILGLQYLWLIKLERTSALAGKAILDGFLEAVTTDALYFYGPLAERVLDVPSSYFSQDRLDRAAAHFKKKEADGARRLFVVRFEHEGWGTILFYDPASESMRPAAPSAEARAVTVACAPWKLMNDKGIEVDAARLVVEERDSENRIVLNPILDETSRVVGAAGMILDSDYFEKRLLPATIKSAIPRFFSGHDAESVTVTLRDGRGTLRFATGPARAERVDASRPFSFVFADWRIGVRGGVLTPEQWARTSFVFNLTLSLLAGMLLVGGLILALRAASREVKLSRMKSDFVSNVSHELRTPLASIRVFGELLKLGRAPTPEKVREYGEYIEAESRRLTQLINNILDFARIEAGQKTYRFEEVDIAQVLNTTLKTFDLRLSHAGFEIAYEGPPEPLPPLRVDAAALGQAFHNLLDNAVNYSGEARRIDVRLERRDGEAVISVKDSGMGISKDEQQKIFERFHRVGTGLVHEVRGSGLGLSIVQHIVRAHEGRITLDSEPGRGSVFSIHLPLRASLEPAGDGRHV